MESALDHSFENWNKDLRSPSAHFEQLTKEEERYYINSNMACKWIRVPRLFCSLLIGGCQSIHSRFFTIFKVDIHINNYK